jgi:hypothetical protein
MKTETPTPRARFEAEVGSQVDTIAEYVCKSWTVLEALIMSATHSLRKTSARKMMETSGRRVTNSCIFQHSPPQSAHHVTRRAGQQTAREASGDVILRGSAATVGTAAG